MVSGCCCYQKRQAARRRELEHAQQQHVFRDATGCAVPAPNGKLFVLPSYEEVLSTHNTGAPPLYSALYDNVVQGPRDVGSLAIPSTSLSSDVDNATVQSVTEHQIEVSVDIRDDDDEHLPAYSSRVGSEDSLITA
ncbi:PREDICTED: uncharacterized protein LOC106819144 [Priapulus caudatus]|uniref:Uncharacterized protein LOC106819144 n=1 Tax=Priapulus caudatus TaxID=37621 RepID=A0ABM1F4B5_PRICU|nr:PREDICTED: uncharacterized protein LOC106819144 [Priapulus caudatus]